MNNIDKQYQALLQDILDNGVRKGDRTGTGTISVFGRQIRHKMSEGFPLLTTKKMAWKAVVTELLWFLRGDTNIKYLVENGCHIWDGDAYKNYVKHCQSLEITEYDNKETFIEGIKGNKMYADKFGNLGPIYGKQWRSWNHFIGTGEPIIESIESKDTFAVSITPQGIECEIDQIANLIRDLKENPDSRRLMVSAWNVGEIDDMVLPPCHYGFQVYTRELSFNARYKIGKYQPYNIEGKVEYKEGLDYITQEQFESFHHKEMDILNIPTRAISLMWNQRSVDTFLGLPFNIASYALLLEIIARMVNMVPDELVGNLGDTHLYSNHIEQAKEQIGRPYTPEERLELLKAAMGESAYKSAVKDLFPFGGGLSEYYDMHKIPNMTREPLVLPKVEHMKSDEFYRNLADDLSLITHLDPTDFKIKDYVYHSSIKAPLSN